MQRHEDPGSQGCVQKRVLGHCSVERSRGRRGRHETGEQRQRGEQPEVLVSLHDERLRAVYGDLLLESGAPRAEHLRLVRDGRLREAAALDALRQALLP